jgi:CheY-like chemotaxis protein
MADVVYLIQDMLFTSKVREVAKQTGVSVQGTRDAAALATAANGAKLVILDLRLPAAADALARLAADPATSGIPSVGFVDHEKTEVMEEARAHGCGQVMAKGQFANALPRLLAALTAPSATPPTPTTTIT